MIDTIDLIQSLRPKHAAYTSKLADAAAQVTKQVVADRVTISAGASQHLERSAEKQAGLAQIRQAVQEDPQFAARMAKDMAYSQDLLAASLDPNSMDNSYYADGTPVTDTGYLPRMQPRLDATREQRIALYESEAAKGTPPAEIYDKMEAFNAAQPEDYKVATGYYMFWKLP